MHFEYDPDKSAANLAKHGIDFEAAQALWSDPYLLELELPFPDEPRWMLIGKIGARHYSAIVTYRNGRTRIISVRRSRKKEIERYENG